MWASIVSGWESLTADDAGASGSASGLEITGSAMSAWGSLLTAQAANRHYIQQAATAGWNEGISKASETYSNMDAQQRAETNIVRISQDRQLMNMDAETSAAQAKAELEVAAAATGTTGSMLDVGMVTLEQTKQKQLQEIDKHYNGLEREELNVIRSTTYNMYLRNTQFTIPEYMY